MANGVNLRYVLQTVTRDTTVVPKYHVVPTGNCDDVTEGTSNDDIRTFNATCDRINPTNRWLSCENII